MLKVWKTLSKTSGTGTGVSMGFFSWIREEDDITAILFHNTKRFGPLNAATHNILRGPSELSVAQREFIAAFVSGLNSCSFCYASHKVVAEAYKVDAQLLEACVADLETAAVDAKMRPLLQIAQKVTRHAYKVVASDIQAITDVGWSEEAAHDTIVIAALFNYYNRLLDGHGIKTSPVKEQRARQFLPRFGYKLPWFVKYILQWQRRHEK